MHGVGRVNSFIYSLNMGRMVKYHASMMILKIIRITQKHFRVENSLISSRKIFSDAFFCRNHFQTILRKHQDF